MSYLESPFGENFFYQSRKHNLISSANLESLIVFVNKKIILISNIIKFYYFIYVKNYMINFKINYLENYLIDTNWHTWKSVVFCQSYVILILFIFENEKFFFKKMKKTNTKCVNSSVLHFDNNLGLISIPYLQTSVS